jgi:hypothetical protein
MQVVFRWVSQERKFHFELSNQQQGSAFNVSVWISPADAVNLFNMILSEIKKAATNPRLLPEAIRLMDPRKQRVDAEKIMLQHHTNSVDDDEPLN